MDFLSQHSQRMGRDYDDGKPTNHIHLRWGGLFAGPTSDMQVRGEMAKEATIKKIDTNKWRVYSEEGKNLGTYTSEAGAKKRLKQVEYFKHKDGILAKLEVTIRQRGHRHARRNAERVEQYYVWKPGELYSDVQEFLAEIVIGGKTYDIYAPTENALNQAAADLTSGVPPNIEGVRVVEKPAKPGRKPLLPPMEAEAEVVNDEGDVQPDTAEDVHMPDPNQDQSRGLEPGWEKDSPGVMDEYGRDRQNKYYGHYPIRGQTVRLARDVFIRKNDLYAVRNGDESDGFIRIKRGSIGLVSDVLPGFDRRTKSVRVKFSPVVEAVFAVGKGHADPRRFLRKAQRSIDDLLKYWEGTEGPAEPGKPSLPPPPDAPAEPHTAVALARVYPVSEYQNTKDMKKLADIVLNAMSFAVPGVLPDGAFTEVTARVDFATQKETAEPFFDVRVTFTATPELMRNTSRFLAEVRGKVDEKISDYYSGFNPIGRMGMDVVSVVNSRWRAQLEESQELPGMFPEDRISMDAFTRQYMETALWASSDEDGASLDDKNYDVSDFDHGTVVQMSEDCQQFREEADALLSQALHEFGYESEQAGHDFWLTRNHHGAGFWDRGLGDIGDKLTDIAQGFGGADLYVGDDGKVYQHGAERRARRKDLVPGGLADKADESEFDPEQLAMGQQVEMEHTGDQAVAREIAMDHLAEVPDYYTRLKKVEQGKKIALVQRRAQYQYNMQQPVNLQVPTGQAGQFLGLNVPGTVMQTEEPGKYKVKVPGTGTSSGQPMDILAIDDTYNKPDAANYHKIQGPGQTNVVQNVAPVQPIN